MSDIGSIRVQPREKVGGGASRDLRRRGFIPGILYGEGQDNTPLEIQPIDIEKGLQNPAFYTTIFELKVGSKVEKALARDVQFDPVTDVPLHVDFLRVSKDTKVNVHIPVIFTNEEASPGLKRGGILNIVLHTLEVSCSADHIPENITIDLTGLQIGDSVHTEATPLPKGVEVTHLERDNTLATIVAPTLKTVEEEDAEAAAAAEAQGEGNTEGGDKKEGASENEK